MQKPSRWTRRRHRTQSRARSNVLSISRRIGAAQQVQNTQTLADESRTPHLRAAIQPRRPRVNTLSRQCESGSPGTLSNASLNGPEPLTGLNHGLLKPFTPERGPPSGLRKETRGCSGSGEGSRGRGGGGGGGLGGATSRSHY